MRPRFALRSLLMASTFAGIGGAVMADPLRPAHLNSYGLPGLVDMPTAESMPDGTLGGMVALSDISFKNSFTFQVLPRLTVALRYSRIDSTLQQRGVVWDRSFDLHFTALDENGWRPSVAVGLRDFMGTGIYSSEYIVATKTISPELRVTAGLGWGRMAGAGSIGTPFGDRPGPDTGFAGTPNADQWFRGPVAPFLGVTWQASDKLSLAAEYSGDSYICETGDFANCPRDQWVSDGKPLRQRINFGANYRFNDLYQVGAYVLGGNHLGLQFSMALDPKKAPYPSGLDKAAAPVRPRPALAADPDGWAGTWASDPTAQPAIQTALAKAMAKEGIRLEGMSLQKTRAEVRIQNTRYIQQAEALGRTLRMMTRALPPSVETLVVTSSQKGMATSRLTVSRRDVERLENRPSAEIAAVSTITDAPPRPADYRPTEGDSPRFLWSLSPYFVPGLFDPDEPIRYELGAEANASYEPMPGLIFAGQLRQRAFGTLGNNADTWQSDNPPHVPVVRSDSALYYGQKGPTLPRLTAAFYAHPSETVYTRLTAGMLEPAYGGVSAEVLWKPNDSRLALGAEVNRVRKRDYEQRFGFQDYQATTAFVSAYYDFGKGITGRLDAGQYLAGDRGVTLAVNRQFANGWNVGAYVTKTNMSAEDFGEGSFDKGISIRVPLSWGLGTATKRTTGGDLRSMNRDGGARLDVQGRLYETVNDGQKGQIYQGWGSFWR